MSFVLGPNQEKWLTELETTTSRQTKEFLHKYKGGYCCLGIACELFNIPKKLESYGAMHQVSWEYEGSGGEAPGSLVELLALNNSVGDFKGQIFTQEELKSFCRKTGNSFDYMNSGKSFGSLVELNDYGWTFKEIAAIVRRHPEYVFKESR